MNQRMVARLIGYILLIEIVAMIPPLGISFAHQEWNAVRGFAMTMLILAAVSFLLVIFSKPQVKRFYAAEGLVVTGVSWVVMAFFGGLPFYISGEIPSLIDSFFEAVSGFTTTGATILTDIEAMSQGLLFWRSFTHWLGGMGVLMFLLAVISLNKGEGDYLHLMRAESPGPDVGKITPRVRQSAKMLYKFYLIITVAETILLLLGGMPLFDTLCTVFGTVGTGGFAVKNASIAAYPSFYLQAVITVFMILSGINFGLFYLLTIKQFSKVLHDEELRVYLGIIATSVLLIALNILPIYRSTGRAFHEAAFQVASIISTTGFCTVDFNLWPELSRSILMLLMLFGACAGSTGGGMKISRLVISLKSAVSEISRMLHPRQVRVLSMGGKPLTSGVIRGVNVYMTIYFTIIGVSFLLVSLDGMTTISTLTAVFSCLNNIGPGLDMVGPVENFAHFSNFSKIILSIDMLLGRLELFPLLVAGLPSIWKKRKNPVIG